MKRRKDCFWGLHNDFHAVPKEGLVVGATLREEDIREICRTLKPDFIQIDCKGHPGWASYPTELGNAMPKFAFDTLELWRRVTREEGILLYMHYSGLYEIKYCDEHPNENAMAADGTLLHGVVRLDSCYSDELMIPQICELAGKYGVDGVWVDGDCWSVHMDYHPETLATFERETGCKLNGAVPKKPGDAFFHEYMEYTRKLYRRYLNHYVDAVHEKYPDFEIASNWAFTDHMPEKVSANVDFLSGDLNPENSFNSARYAGRAIAQQNMPWDLMSWNFRYNVYGTHVVPPKHPTQLLQEAAAVISIGGAFQDYVAQFPDGSPNMNQIRNIEVLKDFMLARKPYCFRAKMHHQAALLISEYDRSREVSIPYAREGYEKVMGATSLLCDAGQSLEIVSEYNLAGHYDDYQLIVVPELHLGLSEDTTKELMDYACGGGSLLLIGTNTCKFFAEHGFPFKTQNIMDPCGMLSIADLATGHDSKAPLQTSAYYFSLDNKNFGAVLEPCKIIADNSDTLASVYTSLHTDGSPFASVMPFGKGIVAAIGADIGSQYLCGAQYLHRKLIRAVTDKLYTPMARIESACGLLEIVCLVKDGKLMLQLVNANGAHNNPNSLTEDFVPPVLDITLSLAIGSKPKKLMLQPENHELSFEYHDGRAYFDVPRLNIHSIVEVIE